LARRSDDAVVERDAGATALEFANVEAGFVLGGDVEAFAIAVRREEDVIPRDASSCFAKAGSIVTRAAPALRRASPTLSICGPRPGLLMSGVAQPGPQLITGVVPDEIFPSTVRLP